MSEVTLFAGPSAVGIGEAVFASAGLERRPPVRRGDIDELLRESPVPGVVVIADGLFHSEPAVSHAELCRALDANWAVWGVSSLGAIRAHELRDEGMRGYGYVHAQFARHADFCDDEMCLSHFPFAPYTPMTEALVNVRYALERAPGASRISSDSKARVIHALRALWFGDRTAQTVRDLLIAQARLSAQAADAFLAWLGANRIKTLDLAHLLAERPWS